MFGQHPGERLGGGRRFEPAGDAATPNTSAHVHLENVAKQPSPRLSTRLVLERENIEDARVPLEQHKLLRRRRLALRHHFGRTFACELSTP